MVEYKRASRDDVNMLMSIRLEMLREVNHLNEEDQFPDDFISESRKYFLEGDQETVLAICGGKAVGCASICYIWMMPTYSHPAGKRAHLMNVYTSREYRRQGIARAMVNRLIEDAWKRGVTEISLDATSLGRLLYKELGFAASDECMVLTRA